MKLNKKKLLNFIFSWLLEILKEKILSWKKAIHICFVNLLLPLQKICTRWGYINRSLLFSKRAEHLNSRSKHSVHQKVDAFWRKLAMWFIFHLFEGEFALFEQFSPSNVLRFCFECWLCNLFSVKPNYWSAKVRKHSNQAESKQLIMWPVTFLIIS